MARHCILLAVAWLAAAALGAAARSGERPAPPLPPLPLPPTPAEHTRPEARAADVSRLIAQLGAPDWRAREDAMQALIALGNPTREALRKAAKNRDAEVRWRAAYALLRLQDALAPPPPDLARELYRSAAIARTRKDSQDAAQKLYAEVAERFPQTKWAAAARLRLAALKPPTPGAKGNVPSRDELARLLALLAAADWQARQAASCRLAALAEAARPVLQEAARSSDPELAWRAQRLLDRLPQPVAADPNVPDPPDDEEVSIAVYEDRPRGGRSTGTASTERLVETLGSPDPERAEAARELLQSMGAAAVPPLLRGLDRCDEVTCVEIMDLLQQLTGEKLGFDPERWRAWRQAPRKH